jgi:hypothetical protein
MLWFSVNFVAFPSVYMSLFQSLNELLERFRFHVLTPNKSRSRSQIDNGVFEKSCNKTRRSLPRDYGVRRNGIRWRACANNESRNRSNI